MTAIDNIGSFPLNSRCSGGSGWTRCPGMCSQQRNSASGCRYYRNQANQGAAPREKVPRRCGLLCRHWEKHAEQFVEGGLIWLRRQKRDKRENTEIFPYLAWAINDRDNMHASRRIFLFSGQVDVIVYPGG